MRDCPCKECWRKQTCKICCEKFKKWFNEAWGEIIGAARRKFGWRSSEQDCSDCENQEGQS